MEKVGERPRILSCFVGLGVSIRVALKRFGRLGEGALLAELVRKLGVGIREGALLFGGLILAPRIKEANLACVTVELLGGESDMSDGAVTALCRPRFGIFGLADLLAFCGDRSAEADLVSLGAKIAHFGGETVECSPLRTKECSCVQDEDEDEDGVQLDDMVWLLPPGDVERPVTSPA